MIVATAGHIDHGKTTLVRALTGVDTDRLPEEKARGISIDLGFAYLRTPGDNLTIGFVDVPGHERFVRNMLAGVCGIDYVLLVVAADDGVMPQTIEHLNIIELLSVKNGVALITKIDRTSPQRAQDVAASVRELLSPTGLASIDVVPVSAVSGIGMDRVRAALADSARILHRQGQQGRRFRFAVDRVFTVAGSGTVATGTVFAGTAYPGDRLMLSPAGVEVRIRTIQKDGKIADQAVSGERCALNLSGVEVADAGRGDWLVSPVLHAPTQRLDVRLQLLGSETRALKHWTPVHLHHGAKDVTARISIRRGAEIRPGESGLAQLIVDKPVAALGGDRFIVRDQSALRTIGGGAVIDPFPPPRRRDPQLRASQLQALEFADPQEALDALLACSPVGVNMSWFARVFNLDDERVAAIVQSKDIVVVGKELRTGLARAHVETINAVVRDALARFHLATPRALGMEIDVLRRECAPQLTAETFSFLLRRIADESHIELSGSLAKLPRHVATDNPTDENLWRRVRPMLDGAGFNGLTIAELAAAAKIREPVLKDFLHRKAKTGELVRVTPERFYLRDTLAKFAAIAESVFRAAPDAKFSAAQVRDRTDIGRTRAIQILECFDRLGITQRIGDLRVICKDFVPILGTSAQQRSRA